MRVAMGSDHAGFELKETLKVALIEEHYEILDVGTHGTGPVAKMLKGNHTLEGYLEAHLSRLRPGDYFALLAYIENERGA